MKIRPLNRFEKFILPVLKTVYGVERRVHLDKRIEYTAELERIAKERREINKILNRKARMYEEIIIKRLQYKGAAHMQKAADLSTGGKPVKKVGRKPIQHVQFSEIGTEEGGERIYFRIATGRWTIFGYQIQLPFGVDVEWITSDDMLKELSYACERLVTADKKKIENGVFLIVNLTVGEYGISKLINMVDLLPLFPRDYTKAPICVGVGEHRDPRFTYLTDVHHMLIAGRSGGGKSNFLKATICGLIRFTQPDEYRFIMIDFKKVEMGPYRRSPHVERMIFTIDESVEVLQWLLDEVWKRTDLLYNEERYHIDEWNEAHPDLKRPHLVLVIDELAQLIYMAEDNTQAKLIIKLLTQLAQVGRALGVHMILATQYPIDEVLPNKIKVNMGLVVSARTDNPTQSVVILGTGDAAALPLIPGRMIAKIAGSELEIVQTPYISREYVQESIAISKGLGAGYLYIEDGAPTIDHERLLETIVDEFGGILTPSRLYSFFADYGMTDPRDFKAAIWHIIKGGTAYAFGREFKVEERGNQYWLIEQGIREEPEPDSPEPAPYTFTQPMPALREHPVILLLPATTGVAPVEASEPLPEPEPELPVIIEARAEPVEDKYTPDQVVDKFIFERCIRSKRSRATSRELNDAYKLFCEELDIEPLSERKFGEALRTRGYLPHRGTGGTRYWKGLELLPEKVTDVA